MVSTLSFFQRATKGTHDLAIKFIAKKPEHVRNCEGWVNNWDTVLQKTTHLSERFDLQFRTEAYNLFNRVQFGQPGNLLSDPNTLGQSTSQVRRPDQTSGARQLQFGLKLGF